MKQLQISKDLLTPINIVTQKIGMLGQTGSGKSYGAMKVAELMLDAGAQIIALDPVGIWYGLRISSDGKGKGYAIPVFGGEYGDLPLHPDSGVLIADLIVSKSINAVLDVSYMNKSERKRFTADFAEHFFQLKKRHKSAVHLFIEESHKFIPQNAEKGDERMVGALDDIIRIGRNKGIGITLISQRPQSIRKDCLNQTEALFAFKMNGHHERKAIKEWIVENSVSDSYLDVLPTLNPGECILWSPQWLKRFGKIKFGKRTTFDTSYTPEVGEKAPKTRELAPIEIDQIKKSMEHVIEEKTKNDPEALKRKIRDLETQLKKHHNNDNNSKEILQLRKSADQSLMQKDEEIKKLRDITDKTIEYLDILFPLIEQLEKISKTHYQKVAYNIKQYQKNRQKFIKTMIGGP